MTHTVKLKRRYPPDGDKSHWVWVLRYWSADACKEVGEVVGWYASARDPWRPRWCKGPRLTDGQAREVRIQRRCELREGRVGQPETALPGQAADPRCLPFGKWRAAYLDETRGTVRDTTLKEIRDALAALDKATSPRAVLEVDARTVKRFIQVRLRGGIQRSTVWKQISSLRRVWYDSGIEPNPWAQSKLRRQLKSTPKDWHWYSADEFQRLMLKCDAWKAREDAAG